MCCAVQNKTLHVSLEKALLLEVADQYVYKGSHVAHPMNTNCWLLQTIQSLHSGEIMETSFNTTHHLRFPKYNHFTDITGSFRNLNSFTLQKSAWQMKSITRLGTPQTTLTSQLRLARSRKYSGWYGVAHNPQHPVNPISNQRNKLCILSITDIWVLLECTA